MDILALKVTYVKVLTLQHLTRPLKQGQNKIEVPGQLGSAKGPATCTALFSTHTRNTWSLQNTGKTGENQSPYDIPLGRPQESTGYTFVSNLPDFSIDRKCVLMSAGLAQMVQVLTLDSKAWVQILPLLFTCHVLAEGPSPLPMPQFPHLQTRNEDNSSTCLGGR